MPIPYQQVVAGSALPTTFTDIALMHGYLDAGSPVGELIYLGFGETWTQVAPGLAATLARPLPRHAHGYVISQYGLPALQEVLRAYIASTHRLPSCLRAGRDFEVAATSGGTRAAMFDFARLLQLDPATAAPPGKIPVLVAPLPGWDYKGVVEPLGYRTRFLPLREGNGCQPSPEEFDDALDAVAADPGQQLALVAINAQHNPTGVNWHIDVVRHMVRASLRAGAAVLLDDAYFAVHDPGLVPTSALGLLLEELQDCPPEARRRWLAVRSLGKQFHCSGWGLGAATAHPDTLHALLNTVHLQRGFATAVPLQHAMAAWLADPAAERFVDENNHAYAEKRALVGALAEGVLGYPAGAVQLGECATFLRLRVPTSYQGTGESIEAFRRACLARAGVLPGVDRWNARWPDGSTPDPPCFRVYLGPPAPVLEEALTRLAHAGLTYE